MLKATGLKLVKDFPEGTAGLTHLDLWQEQQTAQDGSTLMFSPVPMTGTASMPCTN